MFGRHSQLDALDALYAGQQDEKAVTPMKLDEPVYEDRIRFVCISDTHQRHSKFRIPIPDGDVLLHAGDFTNVGMIEDVEKFNSFLGSLPHVHKIVIAGNHERSFDPNCFADRFVIAARETMEQRQITTPSELLTNCCYLENATTTLAGYKIFGSPYSLEFGNWAFMVKDGEESRQLWEHIPTDTDIVLVHGPVYGFGDRVKYGDRVGCRQLLKILQKRVKPKYCIYGHIHEDNGIWFDGTTTFINAAICDFHYQPKNRPYIFDLPLPAGMTKEDLQKLKLEVFPVISK